MEKIKTTGIVRRINDLGQIVIPKSIRRQYDIREGDALELFTTNSGVLFRKYIPETDVGPKILYQSSDYQPELITNRYLYINKNGLPVVSETVKTKKTNYTYREYELPVSEYPRYSQTIEEAQKRRNLFPYEVELKENWQ